MEITGSSQFLLETPTAYYIDENIERYKLFQRLFGKRMYSRPTPYLVDEPLIYSRIIEESYHLDEEQSRAMKQALLLAVEVVDEGYLDK